MGGVVEVVAGQSSGGAAIEESDPCDDGDPAKCLDAIAGQLDEVGNAFKSSWFVSSCYSMAADSCDNRSNCPGFTSPAVASEASGTHSRELFPIGGVAGHRYKVTFTFNAVSVAKTYEGGTRDQQAGEVAETTLYDGFQRDGAPIYATDHVNTDEWQLEVFDHVGAEVRHYFMNSFAPDMGYEGSRTFLLSYSKSIVVVGGGAVELVIHDPNCSVMRNCSWAGLSVDECTDPRLLPNEDAALALPLKYPDPASGKPVTTATLFDNGMVTQPFVSPTGHLTVTAVERTEDAPTHDYL